VDLSGLEEIPAQAGNSGRFLTTNGTTLSWANVNIGDITGVIAGAGLTGGTTSGDATLSVNTDGTTISINGTNQLQLSDAAVSEVKIRPGGANQVMTTNATATNAQWVTSGGDVSGPVGSSTVTRIQGRDVASTAPNLGETLTWNGLAWAPSPVAVAVTTEFYAIDPSNFVGLEPSGGANETVLGLFEANNTFVTDNGAGREIMAPVNLPHGATIVSVTVFCEDAVLLIDNMTISLFRKNFSGGGNFLLTSQTTSILAIGLQTMLLPPIAVANRVIDNNTFSYRLHVAFSHLLNVGNPAAATQRIYGVRIEYTK
jgi:hypothetical protein